MKTCVIYGRVSDPEQAKGSSSQNQEKMCRDYADTEGIEVKKVFVDNARSGRYMKGRRAFRDALEYAKEHNVDFFLVTETDRFFRRKEEHFIVKHYLGKFNCKLIGVNQPFTEGDDPTSKLMDGIVASVNEFYSDYYGEKTKNHMLKKIEKGEWPGWAPPGYRNVNIGTEEKRHNVVQLDGIQASLAKEALELFSTGNYTVSKLNRIMYDRGLRSRKSGKMPKSTFIGMLKNPFYYGIMRYDGGMYPNTDEQGNNTYEPLIDKGTFDKNQEVLAALNKGADRSRKHDEKFFLRRFLQCGICGGKFTAEFHEAKKVSYYHCSLTRQKKHSNKGQNIDASVLEKMVEQEFKKIQLTGPLMEKIVAKAKDILAETRIGVDSKKRGIRNRIQKLEQRRNNLEEDRADRVIEADTFSRQHTKLKAEIEQLEEQLKELDGKRSVNIEIFSRFMELTDDLEVTYHKAEPLLKEHLLGLFFDKIILRDKKISSVRYTKAVQTLLDNRSVIITSDWLPGSDSNRRPMR